MSHYVYFLYHPDGALLYIGRSVDPVSRWKDFMVREEVPAVLGRTEKFDTFEEASAREIEAIKTHQPLYNQKLHSGKGMLGKHHTPDAAHRISVTQKGQPKSEAFRQKMSAVMKGKPSPKKGKPGYLPTPEQRARMGASRLGKKRGPYKKKAVASCA
jgi:hypothetical protein